MHNSMLSISKSLSQVKEARQNTALTVFHLYKTTENASQSMVVKSRPVVARECESRATPEKHFKDTGEDWGVMDWFIILIVVMSSQVYQAVHLKHMQCMYVLN